MEKQIIKNRKIMILFVISLINISLICAANLPIYYKFSVDYDKGKINVKNIGVAVSQIDISDNFGINIYEIIDSNGNVINSNNFAIPDTIVYDYGDDKGELINGKTEVLKSVSFDIFVPYYKNAKEIRFYDENKSELGRSYFDSYNNVGNNIVGNDKDEHGCIGSAGYSWCEEKQKCLRIWEEPCISETRDSESNFIEKLINMNYIIIGLIIILIILIIIFFFYPKKKGKR